ncbi:hypothetical protein DFH27DRAFT_164988 [Peziza echinospora]|nr:hypothetical protein DFH27DRAFT_164988 [Peziza echinospora]
MRITSCLVLCAVLAVASTPESSALPIPLALDRVYQQGIYGIGHFGGIVGRISREEAERIRVASGWLDSGDVVVEVPIAGPGNDSVDSPEEITTSYTTVMVTVTQTLDATAPPTATPTAI